MGFSFWPSGSCAFMLCGGLGMCDFTHVPYMCSVVCNTFGFWTPSFPVVSLIVHHCYTTHPFIDCCRIYDLVWIIYHPTPPILAQPCVGPICRRSSCLWHKKFLAKNGVSIGPMCSQSRHMWDGQLVPHIALMQEHQHMIQDLMFDMSL